MNNETALKIIEEYFAGKATQEQYETALAHFENDPASQARLTDLYGTLVAPGGISCEVCQERMLVYLSPSTRARLSPLEQTQFLQHVTECVACAEEYLALSNFESLPLSPQHEVALPRFKVPKPKPAEVIGNSPTATRAEKNLYWPKALRPVLTKIADTGQTLQFELSFEPTSSGLTSEAAQLSNEVGLFSQQVGANLPIGLEVAAIRSSAEAEYCQIYVTLAGAGLVNHPAGHRVELSYGKHYRETVNDPQGMVIREETPVYSIPTHAEALTDQQGQATFQEVPLTALSGLKIEVTVRL